MPDLDAIAQFGSGGGKTVDDVRIAGRIDKVSGSCSTADEGLDETVTIDFYAARNNQTNEAEAVLPFMVAVVDANQKILNERDFGTTIPFIADERFRTSTETATVHVPKLDPKVGGTFLVLVGFRLTPEQLAFNRAHPRR